LADYYNLVTGLGITPNSLENAGARIYNLEKIFNVQEGWNRLDDYPPPRILNDPIPSGGSKGAYVKKEEFDMMLDAYYQARGWKKNGIPKKSTLDKLELKSDERKK
jgi:aldehyde:ferredoxin oxidoreductase